MTIGKFSLMVAALVTTGAGTFDLAPDGEGNNLTLDLAVDDADNTGDTAFGPRGGPLGNRIHVDFATNLFASDTAATAAEVAAAINAAAAAAAPAGQPATILATVVSSTHVQIATIGLGESMSLEVLGSSTALTALGLTAERVTGTGLGDVGSQPSAPIFHDVVTFTGDSSYPTGGTAGFGAAIQAFFKDRRQVLAVIGQDCGGYTVVYVPSGDKLKVYESAAVASTPDAAAPAAEVANATDLSGVTFNCLVLSA